MTAQDLLIAAAGAVATTALATIVAYVRQLARHRHEIAREIMIRNQMLEIMSMLLEKELRQQRGKNEAPRSGEVGDKDSTA